MRYCNVCGACFLPVNSSQIYCSKECFIEVKRKREKEYRIKNNGSIKYSKGRYSGKVYENSPEKLQAIKEKYKNGVTVEHIKAMLE